MREIVITNLPGVNLEALDAGLRALPGAAVQGLSLRRGSVIVYLRADADAKQVAAVHSLVSGHDPRQPSAAQRAQRQREAALRTAHDDARAARQAAEAPNLGLAQQVALLTRRVAWLEQVLEALLAGDRIL